MKTIQSTRAGLPILLLFALGLGTGGLGALGIHQYKQTHAIAPVLKEEKARDEAKAKEADAKAKEEASKVPILKGVQNDLYSEGVAIALLPDGRAKDVALQFHTSAAGGVDTVLGSGIQTSDAAKLADLVKRLLSENAQIRSDAEHERNLHDLDNERNAKSLADARVETEATKAEVAKRDAKVAEAEVKYREVSERNAQIVAWIYKAAWCAGGVTTLWFLAQVLAAGAGGNPLIAGASKLLNGIFAPKVQGALNEAHQTLAEVGTAIGYAQATAAPAVAQALLGHVNAVITNPAHADIIAASANATSAALTPPASAPTLTVTATSSPVSPAASS